MFEFRAESFRSSLDPLSRAKAYSQGIRRIGPGKWHFGAITYVITSAHLLTRKSSGTPIVINSVQFFSRRQSSH